MKRSLAILFLFAIYTWSFSVGCSNGDTQKNAPTTRLAAPQRIISTSPALTELLFAIGAGDRIVGVTEFCVFPPEAKEIRKIGGIINPSLETIIGLKADLVVLGSLNTKLRENLRATAIPTLFVDESGLGDILQNIRKLGEALHLKTEANALVENLAMQIEQVKTEAEAEERKRVMLVVGRSPGSLNDIYVVGGNVFLDDLIQLAGGENIFGDLTLQYSKISKEEILARTPEIIVESAHNIKLTDKKKDAMTNVWGRLSALPAVKNQRIYFLNEDYLLLPGPRFIHTLTKLKSILHTNDE